MEFKTWFNIQEAAILMSPWEAVQTLNLQDKVGETLSPEILSSIYRNIALNNHPDRNPSPEAVQIFKKATEAFEVLQKYIGQPIPGEHGGTHIPNQTPDSYRRWGRMLAPIGRFSIDDFNNWIKEIVNKQYFQVKVRGVVSFPSFGMNLATDTTSPFGSVVKTFRVTGYAKSGSVIQKTPEDSIRELFAPYMHTTIPEMIVDLQVRESWKEAWITFETPSGKYQSISFAAIKKVVKDPTAGMKKEDVEEHIRASGLVFAGSYTAGTNYGISSDPIGLFIQVGPKTVRLIKRYRTDYYGKKKIDVINIRTEYYGKLKKETLDVYINHIKRKATQSESFIHSSGINKHFAMAVYSIMHNKANATDWNIIDSVSKEKALQDIRSILSDNGMHGEELEKEMFWWRTQIESTGKWN